MIGRLQPPLINLWKQSRDILLVVRSVVDKIWNLLRTLCEQVTEMGDLTQPKETQEQDENEDYPDEDDDSCDGNLFDKPRVIVRFLQLPDKKGKKKSVLTVILLTPIAGLSTPTPFGVIAGTRTIYRGINYESKSLASNAAKIASDGRKPIFHKGHNLETRVTSTSLVMKFLLIIRAILLITTLHTVP